MPTKSLSFYCEDGDIISYGDSKFLVVKTWSNGLPKELMGVSDGITIKSDTPTTWNDIYWVMVKRKLDKHKYWKVCAKIKEMDEKRKEMGYAF